VCVYLQRQAVLLDPEDEGTRIFRNEENHSSKDTVSYSRRFEPSATQHSEPRFSQIQLWILKTVITIGISRNIKKNVPLSDVRRLMVATLKTVGSLFKKSRITPQ